MVMFCRKDLLIIVVYRFLQLYFHEPDSCYVQIHFHSTTLLYKMASLPSKKTPAPPGVAIWISVTLLWGTVFYWTSIVMLKLASVKLGQGLFDPSKIKLFGVYGIHAGVLIVFALVAMLVKRMIDPGAQKQIQRKQAIAEGRGEKLFVSFAGSIATSFFFTGLTALTILVSSPLFGYAAGFTLPVVLLAGLFNIAAGVAASLVVGLVFLIKKTVKKNS
jgi:hypothetical protein